MSDKSRNDLAKSELERPFSDHDLAAARAHAGHFGIVVEQDEQWWYGRSVEMPGVMGDGRTPQAAIAATRSAVITAIATMLEMDEVPPAPARLGARTEQVNVRLSADERLRIEALARQGGFKGMGDYMRVMGLGGQ
ncbi:MAG: hypothetical protein QGI75_03490 [Phycisphaerales bacterium]|jgi:predicted RNase H-like HicB family nuclease|nr:hypothetical protein [Phycisphaerales bacterium]MDP6890829.1 hypothetical protein [Phycisphaerales bacterium]